MPLNDERLSAIGTRNREGPRRHARARSFLVAFRRLTESSDQALFEHSMNEKGSMLFTFPEEAH